MLRIIISGCHGRMGRKLTELCSADSELLVVAGIDVLGSAAGDEFPVFASPAECTAHADVIIDFSSPAALPPLLAFCIARRLPAVLATTGYAREELDAIAAAALKIPVFRSANMSLGVNVLLDLVRRAAAALGSYDIEIVERHHSRKVDAPSGTAKMLADAVSEALPHRMDYVYERASVRRPRDERELGISSVRGGTIVGDHEVIFAGHDEIVEIHHHAASRDIFAVGAIRAAKFLRMQAPGLYDMSHLTGAP